MEFVTKDHPLVKYIIDEIYHENDAINIVNSVIESIIKGDDDDINRIMYHLVNPYECTEELTVI